MASIDRIMALAEEYKKKNKDKNYKVNQSSIAINDVANEIRSGNKTALRDYTYDLSEPAPVRTRVEVKENKTATDLMKDFDDMKEDVGLGGLRGVAYEKNKENGGEAWYKKILQVPDAFKGNLRRFDDGYQFGDVIKTAGETALDTAGTIGGTVIDLGAGAVKGVTGVGENIGALGASGVAQIADWVGQDDYANKVRKNIANPDNYVVTGAIGDTQKVIDKYSVSGETGDKVSESVGQIASIMATGGVGGSGLATATMFGNASGGTFRESYAKEGVTDAQAWTKAIGTGLIEAGTERLFGIFGKSGLDTGIANKVSSKISSGAGKVFSRAGIQASGEAVEEFISYAGNYMLDNGLIDKMGEADYSSKWDWEDVGEQMGIAFIASGTFGAGANVNSISNNMKNNNMNFREALNETARQQDIQGQLEDFKGEKANLEKKLGRKLTQPEIDEIFTKLQQDDTQIKELEEQSKTIPIKEQVEEEQQEVVEPNAQQITEQQELDLQVQNVPKIEQNALKNEEISQNVVENEQKQTETPDIKTKQLEIIQKNNPMTDDYHTGIRSVEDIKTFDETINDEESFVWGDFSQEDAKKALEKGTVTVYSSKPIEQGVFVSTSQNQARDYAGSGKIYSKEVPLNEVAWINGDEGQYAKVDTQTQATNKRQTSDKQATTPTQQEIDNLLDIQQNKSGSEYGLAFDELRKKYGYSNLYKALNTEYSKRKGITQETPIQNTQSIVDNDNAFSNAPIRQDIVEQQRQASMNSLVQEEAPIKSGLATNEQQELDVYEEFISEQGYEKLDQDSKERYAYLKQQQELDTTPEAEDRAPVKDVMEDRDIGEVGKNRKVKAYQQEHPEVKPFFKQEAEIMLQDLAERQEGRRYPIMGQDGYVDHWTGEKRVLAEDLANFKDEYGYKYSEIEEGLKKIIKGDGTENNAISKRLEFLINDRLSKGYTSTDGTNIPADSKYTELLREKEWSDINSENAKTITDEDIAPEQLKEEISNVIQEQVKDIKSELKDLKKQIKEVQAPIKKATQNLFELSKEQQERIQELRDDTKKWTEVYNERYDDKKFAQKRIKGVAMQNSAEIRNITQGDWLIPTEGGLTETELANKISRLRSNYTGKEVLVEGKQGKIIGNSFGKIGVEFTDGTKQYVDKNSIQPLEDIDSIIQEQQRMYETVPEPQKSTVEQPKTEVEENIPTGEKVAQNENTDVSEAKQRSWAETSTESEALKGKILLDDLDVEKITYIPITNQETLGKANKTLETKGYNEALEIFEAKVKGGARVKAEDVTLGQRLMQEALKRGDKAKAVELLEDVSILLTETGQVIQSASIIQRLTPAGQLKMLEKIVDRGTAKGDKAFEGVKLTNDMKERIMDVYNEDGQTYDQDRLNEVMDDIKQEIADQMPVTKMDKINAWRYFSMLGNPKTHLRNIISNVANVGTIGTKNVLARTIEDTYSAIASTEIGKKVGLKQIDRTKTWKKASQEVKDFASQTTLDMKDVILGENQMGEATSIKAKRKIFSTEVLNKLTDGNSNIMQKEDWFVSKPVFKRALQEFLTVNGITTQQDIQNNPEMVEKGKKYALEQSQIAMFRQYSYLANKINEIERKNVATNIAVGSILPFKKTPINIAKTGLAYSPLGFAKTLTYDIAQVKKGNMEASTLIDHISQNTVGSALTLVGYMLAQMGFLNGGGEEDKEGKYDYQLGEQSYSINIGGKSYSLSWLSPVAMPLMVGANAHEQLVEDKEWNSDVVIETLTQTLDPLSEMSFLSSLTSVLSSYETSDMGKLQGMFETMGQNYVTQFIPTLSSQVAGTIDDTKRTTTSTKGEEGNQFINATINKIKYKIPGLRQTLEPSIDIWGNEVKQADSIGQRALDNFIAPYSAKKDITTDVDTELKSVYKETGENTVLPSSVSSNLDYKNEKYKMTNKEYTDFKKKYGQTAYDMLEELFATDTYAESDSTEKAKLISNVYEYARDVSKKSYFDKHNVEYTNTTEDNIPVYKEKSIKNAVEYDMTPEEYSYYEDNPSKYKTIQAITDYETYKTYSKDLSDIKGDKDSNGKTISNSRKAKVYDYINNLDLGYEQKLILAKMEYPSEDQYNHEIIEYLNNDSNIDYDTMESILLELGFKVDANGNITWD